MDTPHEKFPMNEQSDTTLEQSGIATKRTETQESVHTLVEMGSTAQSVFSNLSAIAKEVEGCTFVERLQPGTNRHYASHILQHQMRWLAFYGKRYEVIQKRLEEAREYDKKGSISPFIANTGFGFVASEHLEDREKALSSILRRTYKESIPLADDSAAKEINDAFLHAYETVTAVPNDFRRSDDVIAALNAHDRGEAKRHETVEQ